MKFKKLLKILVALICIGMVGVAANYSALKAEAKTSMTTFQKMRST